MCDKCEEEVCKFKKESEERNPFIVDGRVVCGVRAIGQKVLLWPDPKPEKTKSEILWLPPQLTYKERESIRVATVLSVGPGYYDKKKRRYIPTEIKPGQRVIYDSNVPWKLPIADPSGEQRICVLCTELDVKAIITCCDCTDCMY